MANGPYRADPNARPSSMPPHTGWEPESYPTEGVLGRRLVGYLIDLVMILLLAALLWIAIAVIGLITFGLGWGLFAILPFTGILYSGITLGGDKQATIGMRMMGVRGMDALSGGRVDFLRAAVHALLFYVAAGTFLLWVVDVLIGMARSDGRMGHDLLVGLVFVRAS
jgi:uncharacterized RDD family membrane protein YckC